ncbi:MAG: hypothetical protein AUF79_14300 [Crenarchaeota archaeon 13_1_20CM_2_51_8]|nr:MAG: hypothetical protein AUF79_14300 [Crenarchaeota archaeon 13_1_20CM_2_51_8]
MDCPHCRKAFHEEFIEGELKDNIGNTIKDCTGYWKVRYEICPSCSKVIVILEAFQLVPVGSNSVASKTVKSLMVYPRATARPPAPKEVPPPLAEDYAEACIVLPDSSKASAALSRRCLQSLLRDFAKVKPRDLTDEIQEVLDGRTLPSHIGDALDAVRVIGNFAAHPIKSKQSGQIVPVEPGEAEWTLDVLESLFDHYFVQPARLRERKTALNVKLKEAGKPLMK